MSAGQFAAMTLIASSVSLKHNDGGTPNTLNQQVHALQQDTLDKRIQHLFGFFEA